MNIHQIFLSAFKCSILTPKKKYIDGLRQNNSEG